LRHELVSSSTEEMADRGGMRQTDRPDQLVMAQESDTTIDQMFDQIGRDV
jgi:hypothetical protein